MNAIFESPLVSEVLVPVCINDLRHSDGSECSTSSDSYIPSSVHGTISDVLGCIGRNSRRISMTKNSEQLSQQCFLGPLLVSAERYNRK